MISNTLAVIIFLEVLFTILVAICFIKYEDKFVAFEDKIIFAILRKIRKRKNHR